MIGLQSTIFELFEQPVVHILPFSKNNAFMYICTFRNEKGDSYPEQPARKSELQLVLT
jgi:hypothetical protein